MAHIHLINGEFLSTISEAAGFKTGIALNKEQMGNLFPDDSRYKELFTYNDDDHIRIHSSDVDQIFTNVLYYLGNIEHPTPMSHTTRLWHKYKNDQKSAPIYMQVQELYINHWQRMLHQAEQDGSKTMDPTDFMTEAAHKFGKTGLQMSYELVMGNSDEMHCKLSTYRRFEWEDTVQLEDLFKSESLEASYGQFIDQRYIDFLHRNEDKLGEMNWRKFEALTAEFFDREGYRVELGPGRNDGGIDVRVWKENSESNDPPLLLVQCKRYKSKIDRTVVKALWADVAWEQAESGLIVTTSSIAPGAKDDCIARGYNIKQADKNIIKTWLENMRTPGSGVFMGK